MPLAPFSDEHELARIARRCHDVLWERHGLDPAQAFDELSKLLFVRLYDEATSRGETTVRRGESPVAFAARVRALFAEANRSPDFAGIFDSETIAADGLSVHEVFRHLQGHSLLATTSPVAGADVKGTFYESVVGSTFRGELGQFFTPRSIVEFAVRLLGVDERRVVYDPSCGSGGFLVMCARVLRESLRQSEPGLSPAEVERRLREYGRRCLVGTEINERTARVARLSLLMHGLPFGNVFAVNALRADESDDERLRSLVARGAVDVVLANPPFAGYEKDPAVLAKFELGRNARGVASAVTREVLFLERILDVLREGGVAGIVIPQGIFSNRNLAAVRAYVRQRARILAVVELPDWAFIPSGTSVRGSLLFLQRASEVPADYPVFVRRVERIGYDSTGRPDERDDLPEVLAEYRRADPRYLVSIREMSDRLDARFYLPEHGRVGALFQANPRHRLVKLCEVGSFVVERVNPRLEPGREFSLIETSAVDPTTLAVSPKRVSGEASPYTSLRRVRSGDVLVSRRRAYRGAVVVVPPDLDGALAIPEFSVLRPREGIDPDYVAEVLRSAQFRQLMTIHSTGELSGRISERDLGQLRIPLPENHREIGSELRTRRRRIAELRELAAAEERRIYDLCSDVIQPGA